MATKSKDGYVNKTFRLRKEYLEKLELDASKANMSTNSLISSILERYMEWDSLANVVHFVSLPPNMVDGILANVTEESMSAAGKYIAEKSCFKDLSLHFFQAYTPPLFTRLTVLFDRYANNYKVQGDRTDGGTVNISFYHEFGKKWSLLISNLIHHELLRLGIDDHSYEVSENAVIFSFSNDKIGLPADFISRE